MTWTIRRATFNGIGVTSDCRCWLVTFTEYYRKREVSDVIRRFSCDDLFQFAVRVFLALPGFVMLGVQHFPSCEKQPSDPAKRVI